MLFSYIQSLNLFFIFLSGVRKVMSMRMIFFQAMILLVITLITICTTGTFTPFCALDSQLEALAITFQTSRFLASAAFSMLHCVICLCNLCDKGIWISFLNFFLCLLDDILVAFLIKTIFASTIRSADTTCCKAITI